MEGGREEEGGRGIIIISQYIFCIPSHGVDTPNQVITVESSPEVITVESSPENTPNVDPSFLNSNQAQSEAP